MSAPTNLVTVRPGLTLQAPAAASWQRMEDAHGGPLSVNSSYRDYDTQQKAYDAYRAYLNGGPWAPLALPPDESWHCLGLAVDTDDDAWVRAHPEFGWRFIVKTEKWHSQYYPEYDQHAGDPAGGGSKPFVPTPEEEDDMDTQGYYAKGDKAADVYRIAASTGKRRYATDGELRAAQDTCQKLYGKPLPITVMPQAVFDAIPKQ